MVKTEGCTAETAWGKNILLRPLDWYACLFVCVGIYQPNLGSKLPVAVGNKNISILGLCSLILVLFALVKLPEVLF